MYVMEVYMGNLLLTPVYPIQKKEYLNFVYIAKYSEIKSWNISVAENPVRTAQSLTLVTPSLSFNEKTHSLLINAKNAMFLNVPVIGTRDTEQYPVIFINSSIPYIHIEMLAHQLMRHQRFSLLIEDKPVLSRNSTKLTTLTSISNIIEWIFFDIDPYELPLIQKELFIYIDALMDAYPFLDYLPLKRRKLLKATSYIDSVIAWYMYLRYFKEFFYTKKLYQLPALDKQVVVGNWQGNFFDRQNPLWKEIDQRRNSPYSSEANNSFIYHKWIHYVVTT